jgi:histidine triad (HIT) family protein
MASIFTKIIAGEIPCHRIAENNEFLAFLDINPLKEGHTLVIPKKEIDYLFDIDDNSLSAMIVFAKKIAKAIEKSVHCKRIGLTVIGLEVPHAHIHLIPIESVSDINFSKEKLSMTRDDLGQLALKIAFQVEL